MLTSKDYKFISAGVVIIVVFIIVVYFISGQTPASNPSLIPLPIVLNPPLISSLLIPLKPCAPPQLCPAPGSQLVGYQRYKKASLRDVSTPLICPPGYMTQAGSPDSCLLPPNLATKACSDYEPCVGLFVDPGNNGLMKLVNKIPDNTGSPTNNYYYGKI